MASFYLDKEKLKSAMRGNGALAWGEHSPCMFCGAEKFFRPGYRHHLVGEWLASLDGVVETLRQGAKVADIGCSHGASTVIMAQAFPQSRFIGFDLHDPSIECARQRAMEGGVEGRAVFTKATDEDFQERDFDLICFFDCLHDMGDPVGAARHALQALKPDGAVLLVAPMAGDRVEENLNPVGRHFYAASTFVCTPNSLSQEVGMGLGAQAGEAQLKAVFEEAGFRRFRRAASTPFNLILEARKSFPPSTNCRAESHGRRANRRAGGPSRVRD